MNTRFLICTIAVICAAALVRADEIKFKNGDRLSGTIVKSDAKALVIKSDFAGEVTVQRTAIQEITSSQPLYFELKDGKKVGGPVQTRDGNLAIGSGAAAVNVPLDAVVTIRSQAEQTAYDKTLAPSLFQQWKGGATVGYAVTTGNSETRDLSLAFNAARKTLHDGITLYANTVYANAPNSLPSTTANADAGGIRYDRNFAPSVFGFGTTDFQYNGVTGLSPRSILGGGLGWHAIKNANTTLDILGGVAYTHEHYFELTRNYPTALIGDQLTYKLSKSTTITQALQFDPDLTAVPRGPGLPDETGQYNATFNLGTVTKISKWFGWQNAMTLLYSSDPPQGKKKNDLLVTTGLNIAFAH